MLKLVLTGGPCAGKTRIMSHLTELLEERGYFVFVCPETATELILNGISPATPRIGPVNFQEFVLDKQLSKENLYDELVKYYPEDKLIIIYDRGLADACAYVDKKLFENMLKKRNMTFSDMYSHYDAVIHLVTTADGAEEFYQWNDPSKEDTGNNAARYESPEEARISDKKTLDAWIGHQHLRVVDNTTDFEGKIKRVLEEVFGLLGEPVPLEIERKFLIKKPTKEQIEKLGYVSRTNIIQTYLKRTNNDIERRLRQRGTKEDGYYFYYTEKTDVGHGERVEIERKLTKDEYITLLAETDSSLHQISKERYCFVYDRKYYEMDLYPFDDDYAIIEIELNDINEAIKFPPLVLVKEVTDDKNFRNSALAKTLKFVV